MRLRNTVIRLIATGLFTGYSPVVPGTVGTIPAWLIAFFLIQGHTVVVAVATVVLFVLSIWSAGEAEKALGRDAKKIVIDEWAGMFLSLLMVPYSLTNYLIAFVAFRAFDVIKIPPARQSERLPGGWGVTMDDIVAGIQANLATQIVIRLLDWWR